MTKSADLEPGWLQKEFDDIAALRSGEQKIVKATKTANRNGYTQPMTIEFTVPELRAMDYIIRCHALTRLP